MEVALHAAICDQQTIKIMHQLQEPFELIGKGLSQDYGGKMEHLWIDFELTSSNVQRKAPYSFRFQKRVSGKSRLTGINNPDWYNVGHYSVRPEFEKLHRAADAVHYALQIIYSSTVVLIEKQKKLDGFNAEEFRSNFIKQCKNLGYIIEKSL